MTFVEISQSIRRHARHRLTSLAAILLLTLRMVAAAPGTDDPVAGLGLSVGTDGRLKLQAVPFRGLGVNYYDAFVRTLTGPASPSYEAGFATLASHQIPFARFSAGGYWPADWALYLTNRAEHFRRLDGVFRSAERHGIGLIPSLFWHLSTVPDLMGEPVNSWGDPQSQTHAFMKRYIREMVLRYRSSPALWAWEFGNEYNLATDLPNAAEHRPPIVPNLGTPTTRSGKDDLTHAAIETALRAFAREVRQEDPDRVLISGNAFPRLSAWHQAARGTWETDTPAQFAERLAADNPAPINTLSVRGYDLASDLGRIPRAMQVSAATGKPLFVGEFGVPGKRTPESQESFAAILRNLRTNGVPLAALWVFDFAGQAADWSVTGTGDRAWQLEAIAQANRELRAAAGP